MLENSTNTEIENSKSVKAIALLEIANGIIGLVSIAWYLIDGAFFGLSFLLMPLYWSLYVYAGIQLLRKFIVGLWFSLVLQAIAIPVVILSSGYVSFNNKLRIPVSMHTSEHTFGIDLLALVVFLCLIIIKHKWDSKEKG